MSRKRTDKNRLRKRKARQAAAFKIWLASRLHFGPLPLWEELPEKLKQMIVEQFG